MNNTDPLKPGMYTSELYITVVSSIIGLLIAAGVIHPANPDQLTSQIATIMGAAITIFTTISYIMGRSQIKASAVTPAPVVASPTVIQTPLPAPADAPQHAAAETIPAPLQSAWTPDPGLTRQMPKVSATKAAAQDMPNISPI